MNAWNDDNGKGLSISNTSNIHARTNIINKNRVNENYLIAVGSRSARSRKRRYELILMCILFILVIILFTIIIVISIYYYTERGKRVCQSKECVRSAANILTSMDPTADPCDDFYKYACGNWAEDHGKPDHMSSYNLFSDKQEKVDRMIRDILKKNSTEDDPLPLIQARDMYKACMDTESINSLGMKPVIDLMKSVGLSPIPNLLNLTKGFDYSKYNLDWIETIVKIKKNSEFDMLIGFDILFDFSNTTLKILTFGQPSGTMLFPGYKNVDDIFKLVKLNKYKHIMTVANDDEESVDEEKDDDEKELMKLYKLLMKTAVKEVIESVPENMRLELSEESIDTNIDTILKDYISLYREIYSVLEDDEYKSDVEDIVYKTVFKLQNKTDSVLKKSNLTSIDVWKRYVSLIFNNTNITINFNTDLVMTSDSEMNSVHKIIAIVQNTTRVRIEMFLWFQLLENCIPHTTTTIRDVFNKFLIKALGAETYSTRSTYCSGTVNEMMGMAVGYAFINSTYENNTIKKAKTMLENIKIGLEDMIVSASWMDTATKVDTVEKIHTMKSLIGFPDWLIDREKLESYYKGVSIDLEKHLDNQIDLLKLIFKNKINGFREPHILGWTTVPTEANAFHTYAANTITIPYVMLQYPFFNLGLEALNYGALGAILGHELTHGIDNIGRGHDKDGNLKKWWSNSSIDNYVENSQCLIKQFSDFYVAEVNGYVDGNLTLDENIADNGGLKSALKGYWKSEKGLESLPGLDHLRGDQLFFLSHGNLWCGITTATSLKYSLKDSHSPNHFRINGNLQNTPEFAKAWNCPVKSKMNPSVRPCIMF